MGDGFEVIADELRATDGELELILTDHPKADLVGSTLGDDIGHSILADELSDFATQFDHCEGQYRTRASDLGDTLSTAAYYYDNADLFLSQVWLAWNGDL